MEGVKGGRREWRECRKGGNGGTIGGNSVTSGGRWREYSIVDLV